MSLTIAAFIAASSLISLIALLVTRAPDPVERRLETLHRPPRDPSPPASSLASPGAEPARARNPAPRESEKRTGLGERLVQAGLYKRNSIGFYMTAQVVLFAVPGVFWFIASNLGWVTPRQALLLGVLTGALGVLMPSFWLDAQKRRRQTQLRRALPDALDVITVCMEAGLSLPAAFTRVANELRTAHPMLAAEMLIVQREIQMGCSTGEALRHFADRFDLEELRSMASVILQAEKFGASIVQALRVHAESLRVKRYQQAEEKAQKAAVKILFPTIFFIFPALFVIILGPAAFNIYKTIIQGM